jgi:hypothetical protein
MPLSSGRASHWVCSTTQQRRISRRPWPLSRASHETTRTLALEKLYDALVENAMVSFECQQSPPPESESAEVEHLQEFGNDSDLILFFLYPLLGQNEAILGGPCGNEVKGR